MGGGALLFLALAGAFLLLSRFYGMVIGRWGYTLSIVGDDIHLRYGMLDVRQLTIPRRRVQQVTVVDNPLRRALGVASLTMHSAAGPGGGGNEGTTRFEVPLLERADVDGFLAAMMGTAAWYQPSLEHRPASARRRAVLRRCVLLALFAVLPAIAWFPIGTLAFVVTVLGVPWGLVAHDRAGHGRTGSLVVFSRGVLHHLLELVPTSRVQSARTDTNPLQRANGLATLHVDIAGDRKAPRLYDMDAATAAALVGALPRVSSPGASAERRMRGPTR
jgi:putative membrane protein